LICLECSLARSFIWFDYLSSVSGSWVLKSPWAFIFFLQSNNFNKHFSFLINSNGIVIRISTSRIAVLYLVVYNVLIKSWLSRLINPKFAWNRNGSRILLVVILIHNCLVSSSDMSWYNLNSSFELSVLECLEIIAIHSIFQLVFFILRSITGPKVPVWLIIDWLMCLVFSINSSGKGFYVFDSFIYQA